MDRRHLLHLGMVGIGSALVTHQVGSAAAAARLEEELAAARAATQAEVQAQAATERELFQAGYEARIHRLEQELAIYETMDNIGLDRLIDGVLDTYERIWLAVRVGIIHLQQGVGWVDETLARFEQDLPTLRGAARTVAELLLALDGALTRLGEILAAALKRTEPLTDLVSGFFSWILDHAPFGVGDSIRNAMDRFRELVGIAPAVVHDTEADLLLPLRERWLSEEQDQGLQGGLFAPLRAKLLTPVAEFLERLERMSSDWEQNATPLRTALAEREQARARLAALRADAPLPQEDSGPA